MSKLLRVLLAFVLTGAVLAGCGGDDDDDGGADVSADADVDVDEGDLEDVTDALGAFTSEDCAQASTAYLSALASAGAAFTGGGGEDIEEAAEALERFADNAPDEIKADLKLVAEAVGEYVRVMAEIGFDPSSGEMPDESAMAALAAAAESFNSDELSEASDRLSVWFEANCDPANG